MWAKSWKSCDLVSTYNESKNHFNNHGKLFSGAYLLHLNICITDDAINSISRYISNRNAYTCLPKTCTRKFTAALLKNIPNQKLLECSSAVEWGNTLWYVHTAGYHTGMRTNNLWLFAKIYLNLRNIMFSKRRQTQKSTSCKVAFIERTKLI